MKLPITIILGLFFFGIYLVPVLAISVLAIPIAIIFKYDITRTKPVQIIIWPLKWFERNFLNPNA